MFTSLAKPDIEVSKSDVIAFFFFIFFVGLVSKLLGAYKGGNVRLWLMRV